MLNTSFLHFYLVMLSPRLHGVGGRWRWLWGIGGMAMTGENQNTWRKSLIVSTWSGIELGFLELCGIRILR